MKIIMAAAVMPINGDRDNAMLTEEKEIVAGRIYNGDVRRLVDEQIKSTLFPTGPINDKVKIHNVPDGAVPICSEDGYPFWVYWAEEIEDKGA